MDYFLDFPITKSYCCSKKITETVFRLFSVFCELTVTAGWSDVAVHKKYNSLCMQKALNVVCKDSTFLNSFSLQKLEQLNQYPDFNNYLIFVLTKLKSEGKFLR